MKVKIFLDIICNRLNSTETQIPGFGTWIGTDSLGTLGTGTNIAGTVAEQKSLGQPNPKVSDKLGL